MSIDITTEILTIDKAEITKTNINLAVSKSIEINYSKGYESGGSFIGVYYSTYEATGTDYDDVMGHIVAGGTTTEEELLQRCYDKLIAEGLLIPPAP